MWIRRYAPPREPSPCKNGRVFSFADMAELADALDLGSSGRPCRFESCYPHTNSLKAYAFGLFFMFGDLENASEKWKNYGFDIYFDSNSAKRLVLRMKNN